MPQAGIDPPAQSHASTPKPPRLDPSTFIDGHIVDDVDQLMVIFVE